MKKKFEIINALMSVVILFAILFQSVHSYEHLVKHLSEKKCLHKRVSSQEITHQHHNSNHCFVCEFGFSTFITSAVFCFKYQKQATSFGYTFLYSKQISNYFKGSLFALRAPPIFIV
jgi:hypothetical protein